MKVKVLDVQDKLLRPYIQSFLFISSSGGSPDAYTTFPNTNLCLSIYYQNHILYTRDQGQNLCQITRGVKEFKSLLYGFHEHPFTVEIESVMDQICILFYPGALRAFTKISYHELHASDSAFELIFTSKGEQVLEQVFSHPDNLRRAQILEYFLISRIAPPIFNPIVLHALEDMTREQLNSLKIEDLAKKYGVNTSTLYRLFLSNIGQNPKSFLNTIRFRKALKHLLDHNDTSCTSIAYISSFHDQPHFNKDIKRLSGFIPSHLRKVASIEQGSLAWVHY